MDPQQEIFSELFKRIKEDGYDVYDGFLPPDNTPYPFVYLADNQQLPFLVAYTKRLMFGTTIQKKGEMFHKFCSKSKEYAEQ